MRTITVLAILVSLPLAALGDPHGPEDCARNVPGGRWWHVQEEPLEPPGPVQPPPCNEAVPATIVALPGAGMLDDGAVQLDARALFRRTGGGMYSNLRSADLAGQDVGVRLGFARSLELALSGNMTELSAEGTAPGQGIDGSSTMSAWTGSVKFRLPDEVLGNRIVFGAGGSVLSEEARERYQPADYLRLAPLYMLVSRDLHERLRGELVFLRGRVLSSAGHPGTNLTTFAGALELSLPTATEIQLEVVREVISRREVGLHGTTVGLDGNFVNLGLRQALGTGSSLQVYGQHVNRAGNREVGLVYGHRL